MHGFASRCLCVCYVALTSPAAPRPCCVYMCVSQPSVKVRPPLPIRDVHRDWQFRWHDLRSQHQRPQLLRGGGPKLGWRRWRWRLWLRRWGQTERQKHWCEASQGDCWRGIHMAPTNNGSRFCQVVTWWRNGCCCVEKQAQCSRQAGKQKESSFWSFQTGSKVQ